MIRRLKTLEDLLEASEQRSDFRWKTVADYTCGKCQKTKAARSTTIVGATPDYLIVQIQRFKLKLTIVQETNEQAVIEKTHACYR